MIIDNIESHIQGDVPYQGKNHSRSKLHRALVPSSTWEEDCGVIEASMVGNGTDFALQP